MRLKTKKQTGTHRPAQMQTQTNIQTQTHNTGARGEAINRAAPAQSVNNVDAQDISQSRHRSLGNSSKHAIKTTVDPAARVLLHKIISKLICLRGSSSLGFRSTFGAQCPARSH